VAIFSLAGETDHPLLRFTGTLFGRPATFLVDSGATNDFVAISFVQQHALPLLPNGRTVRAFDGTVSSSAGELRAPLLLSSDMGSLPDSRVIRPFTAVQLKGEDAILGQPWLRSINPQICWATGAVHVKRPASSSAKLGQRPELTYHLLPAPATMTHSAPALGLDLIESICTLYSESNQKNNPTTDGRLAQLLTATVNDRAAPPSKGPPPQPTSQLDTLRESMFKEYTDVFPDSLPDGLPPSRAIDHKIELKPGSAPPTRANIRYSRADDAGIAAYVEENLKKGFIRASQSSYAAIPFQVSKKGTDERRTVVDFRALNQQTVKSKYPLPRMDVLFDRLQGATYFSKLDLRTGFHQIRIAAEDTHKTAFRTSKGLYEYLVLAMGLCNAPGTFMQLMNDTFTDMLNKSVLVFLDDIIIFSNSLEEHQQHLRAVLKRLRREKLYAKKSKCALFQQEVEFLGHYVGVNGLRIMEDKLQAVTDWPTPRNVREVRAFLGLAGFYRRFIRDFSRIALPLTALTRTVTGSGFVWGTPQQLAFIELKQALQSAPILILPNPELPYVMHTDASGFAVGGVLQQDQGKGLQPIAFLSKKMSDAETRYPVHEQELLAIVTGLATWRHYLVGAELRVFTDHKSLIHFQTQPMLSGRQTRWLETLSLFDFTIVYVKGTSNVVADAFSRRADLSADSTPLDRPAAFVDPQFQSLRPVSTCAQLMECVALTEASTAAELSVARLALAARQSEILRAREREHNRAAAQNCSEPSPDLPVPNQAGIRVMPTQRCTASTKTGGHCRALTRRGQYCWNHLRTIDGLRIKASSIPGAGLGLFAEKDFPALSHLTRYTGDYRRTQDGRIGGYYFLQLTNAKSIDAARTNTDSGRWANDSRASPFEPNSELVTHPATGSGRLRATRNIKKGEEIFVAYGPRYWASVEGLGYGRKRGRRASDDPEAVNLLLSVLTSFHSPLAREVSTAVEANPQWARELVAAHKGDDRLQPANGHFYLEERLCIPPDAALRTRLIRECHDASVSGHLGKDKTSEQLQRRFYWKGMHEEVRKYVLSCDACQRNKPAQQLPLGLLQPLPIPPRAFHTWTMDLITGLPRSKLGHDAITVFVCKASKLVHFAACVTAISAPQLARLFADNVVRLHGLPETIISDRDPRFTATFWRSFWASLGTSLTMSTAYHPQTDGQTENSNKTLETILRSVVNFEQNDWDLHLTAAELAVNNSKNATTGYTPFFLAYGREVRMPLDAAISPLFGANSNAAATAALSRWEEALEHARRNSKAAQASQARYADQHRRNIFLKVGDRVLLSTKHLRLVGDAHRTPKLASRFIGPYPIKRVVNVNAYELDLPPSLRIHPVINVSQLKPYRDGSGDFPHRPPPNDRPAPEAPDAFGQPSWVVERILDKRPHRGGAQYLVLWKGYPQEEASWEPASALSSAPDAVRDYESSVQEAPREQRRRGPQKRKPQQASR
jgi:hypothetical protein